MCDICMAIHVGVIQRLVKQADTWSSIITENIKMEPQSQYIEYFLKANLHYNDLYTWVNLGNTSP